MSQENVDLVHKLVEAFNRHDLETLAALSDADLEFVSVLTAIEAGGATYRGPNTWEDYFTVMDEAWEEWQAKDVKVFDASEDLVATVFQIVGTGKNSGARAGRTVGLTYRFREGKVWRMRSYMDPDEALKAVGLRK